MIKNFKVKFFLINLFKLTSKSNLLSLRGNNLLACQTMKSRSFAGLYSKAPNYLKEFP